MTSPDFTEARYAEILDLAKSRFAIVPFGEDRDGHVAIWRHDIDFSPHRALSMARIEAARAVRASYYVLLSSPFYNPLEAAIAAILRKISNLGHDIGLHYDASDFAGDTAAHVRRIACEAALLAERLQAPIRSFSLHNPSVSPDVPLEAPEYGGLRNASEARLRETYTYVSDSNGRWRYRNVRDVLEDDSTKRAYVLTHPEWWTPEPLSPEERVQRCIRGRAERVSAEYRAFLTRHRPEVLPAR